MRCNKLSLNRPHLPSPCHTYQVWPAKLFGISPSSSAANENVAWNFNNSRTIPRAIDTICGEQENTLSLSHWTDNVCPSPHKNVIKNFCLPRCERELELQTVGPKCNFQLPVASCQLEFWLCCCCCCCTGCVTSRETRVENPESRKSKSYASDLKYCVPFCHSCEKQTSAATTTINRNLCVQEREWLVDTLVKGKRMIVKPDSGCLSVVNCFRCSTIKREEITK